MDAAASAAFSGVGVSPEKVKADTPLRAVRRQFFASLELLAASS